MREIIVVEGHHDAARLKQINPHFNVIVTEGSALPEATILMLEKLSQDHKIILMLDPDYPGESIRKILADRLPSAQHVFVRNADCIEKKGRKVGIEHAALDVLKTALKAHIKTKAPQSGHLTMPDLVALGLSGSADAAMRRAHLSEALSIGHCNAKTLLKRLNWLGLNTAQIMQVMS